MDISGAFVLCGAAATHLRSVSVFSGVGSADYVRGVGLLDEREGIGSVGSGSSIKEKPS